MVSLGGAASWRRLRAVGVHWGAVAGAVRVGTVVRLRRGAYAVPGADPHLIAAVRLGGVLACASAATYLGLPVLMPAAPHVIVPRGWSHASAPGVRVHRQDLRPDEHDGVATTLLRTALDCARELPTREAVVVCDAAVRAGLGLEWLKREATGRGRAAMRNVLAVVDGRCESPLESCLRLLLRDLGRLEVQVYIAGVGRVDMVLDGWLVVEGDGFEFHRGRADYRNDRRRGNAIAELGMTLLRFSYEDVVHRPEAVARTVRAVLARRPSNVC